MDCKSAENILTAEFVIGILIIAAISAAFFFGKMNPKIWERLISLIDKGKGKVLWSNMQIVSSIQWTLEMVFPQPFATLLRMYEITELNPLGSLSLACVNTSFGSFKTYALTVSLVPIGLALLIWFVYLVRISKGVQGINKNDNREVTATSGKDIELVTLSEEEAKQNERGEEGISPNVNINVKEPDHSQAQSVFNEHMHATLVLIYLVYPTVSSAHFRSFVCTDFMDGSSFLRADTSVDCTSQGYHGFFVAIIILLVAYQTLPLILFTLLYRLRDRLNPPGMSDPEAAFSYRLKHRHDPDIAPLYFLFGDYSCGCYWWEVVDMYRRMIFTGLVSQFGQGQIRAAAGTTLSLAVVVIFREVLPYHSAFVNRLSVVAQYQVFAAFVGAFVLLSDFPMQQNTLGMTLMVAYIAFLPLSWQLAMISVTRYARDESELFCGRFEISDARPKICRENAFVSAKDVFDDDRPVTIKFIRDEKVFNRETRHDRPSGFLELITTSQHPDLRGRWDSDLHIPGLHHPFGIVQPAVQDSLDSVLLQGLEFFPMTKILLDCAQALGALHCAGRIHGSFSSSNVVREAKGHPWQLVGLETSVKLGDPTDGIVFGSSPPEMLKALKLGKQPAQDEPLTPGDRVKIAKPGSSKYGQTVIVREANWNGSVIVETEQGNEVKSFKREHIVSRDRSHNLQHVERMVNIKARTTHDVWAFGCFYFQAFSLRPLFLTNMHGLMASPAEKERLANWTPEDLRVVVWCV